MCTKFDLVVSLLLIKRACIQNYPIFRITPTYRTKVALLQQAGGAKVSTRGMYLRMSSEKKAEIGKRAAEHGVLATVRYYASRLPAAGSINESSSAREIEFQHVTPINNVGVACLGQ